jgi:hypothetical protein
MVVLEYLVGTEASKPQTQFNRDFLTINYFLLLTTTDHQSTTTQVCVILRHRTTMHSFISPCIFTCAVLLLLTAAAPVSALLDTVRLVKRPSPSELSMAWTLPAHVKPNFKPTWYQDCGNPTVRRVVYDDDLYADEDSYEFSFHNYGNDWSINQDTSESSMPQQEAMPRGARIGRAARRAINGIRNTLRP